MKVLHVITEPEAGGAEKIVRWFAELGEESVEHYAVYLRNPKGLPLGPKESSLSEKSYIRPDIVVRLWLFLLRNHSRYDVVHTHLTWPLYYVAFYSFLFPCPPLVHTEHNTYNRRREIAGLRKLERFIYGRYEKIICISNATRESLVTWLGHKDLALQRLEVIANGVKLLSPDFLMPKKKEATLFLSIGALSKQKNFIPAMARLAELEDYGCFSYLIAGDGPLKREYQQAIQGFQLESKIQLLGYVSNIQSLVSQAHVALIPSLWEGFGLVAVEFLSAGLPVIVNDVPGLRDVVEGCGNAYTIDFNDQEQFESAVSDILRKFDSEEYDVSESVLHAKKYSIERMKIDYDRVYANL